MAEVGNFNVGLVGRSTTLALEELLAALNILTAKINPRINGKESTTICCSKKQHLH